MKFKSLFFVIVLSATTLQSAPIDLPDIGSSADQYLSLIKEQEMGDILLRQIKGRAPIFHDPLIDGYIKTLGFKLVAHNTAAINRRFDFFVINATSINAFAMPGGYVFMHSGLILKAESEDELAGVLAHEIAHVTQRHIARRFEKTAQLSMPSMIGMLVAILASQGNAQAGIAGLSAVTAGAQQLIINHTRANEAEADRVGIQTLAEAGFDPNGMASFFGKLLKEYRYYPKPPEFLLTHPLSEKRLAEARTKTIGLKKVQHHTQSNFLIIQERIRALSVKNPLLMSDKEYQHRLNLTTGLKHDAILHGYAVWLKETQHADKAVPIAQKLVKKYPKSIAHRVLLGETLIADEQYQQAINTVEDFLVLTPLNYPLTLILADAEDRAKHYKKSLNLLLSLAWQHPEEPLLFKFLAEVQVKNGFKVESRESQGQYLYAVGDLNGALFQYKQALNGMSDDPYFNTRVRARILAIQDELSELRGRR